MENDRWCKFYRNVFLSLFQSKYYYSPSYPRRLSLWLVDKRLVNVMIWENPCENAVTLAEYWLLLLCALSQVFYPQHLQFHCLLSKDIATILLNTQAMSFLVMIVVMLVVMYVHFKKVEWKNSFCTWTLPIPMFPLLETLSQHSSAHRHSKRIKEYTKICDVSFGWSNFYHMWFKNGGKYSCQELVHYLKNHQRQIREEVGNSKWILRWHSQMKVSAYTSNP